MKLKVCSHQRRNTNPIRSNAADIKNNIVEQWRNGLDLRDMASYKFASDLISMKEELTWILKDFDSKKWSTSSNDDKKAQVTASITTNLSVNTAPRYDLIRTLVEQ